MRYLRVVLVLGLLLPAAGVAALALDGRQLAFEARVAATLPGACHVVTRFAHPEAGATLRATLFRCTERGKPPRDHLAVFVENETGAKAFPMTDEGSAAETPPPTPEPKKQEGAEL